jgi:hypothetical protein
MDLREFLMHDANTFPDQKISKRWLMKYAKRMFALMLIALPILAVAQMTSSTKIVGEVPFPFVVGNKHVPAGEWTVEKAGKDARTLVIRNFEAKLGLFIPSMPDTAKKPSDRYALVFHKYGDKAFLAGVKLAGDRTIYKIPETREESELRAQNVTATEEILLASAK